MTDDQETDFAPSPGDVVLDRDDDDADPAVVVNIPPVTAEDWTFPRLEKTVAEDNPDYAADALVAVVMYESYIRENDETMPEWDRENAIPVAELYESGLKYYVFPRPRLTPAPEESSDGHSPTPTPTLTNIQYVGDERAEDLRAEGFESVGDVAEADQSALAADVDGIGNTRAAQITASANNLLGELSVDSAADAPDETDPDATEDRETTDADNNLSAAVVALSRYLDTDGMDTAIADDGQSVRVTNADHSYWVSLDGVEGDGPHRSQLTEAVEKVRAATQQSDS